jgi:hypothetical protein
MRRLMIALCALLGLIAAMSLPADADTTSALATLACSDGTSLSAIVDPTTLIDLTGEAQALIPSAGAFSCVSLQDLAATDTATMTVTSVPPCTPTDLIQDGHPLTARMIDPTSVTGAVDGMGCDIAVYYSMAGSGGTISSADISDAVYYGVADNKASAAVNILNTSIHNIGNAVFDGSQHGVGIFYTGGSANGTVDNDSVYLYQKNGMAIKNGANVIVTNNTVTGRGRTKIIAQNGIELFHATSPNLSGNTVSLNIYTQNTSCTPGCVGSTTGVTATGFLLFDTNFKNPGEVAPFNHAFRNQVDYYVVNP